MTAEPRTCPGCGRTVRGDHQLCVKCGARLPAEDGGSEDRPRTVRRVQALAIGGVIIVLGVLGLVIWRLGAEPPPRPAPGDRRGDESSSPAQVGERPPRGPDRHAGLQPPPRRAHRGAPSGQPPVPRPPLGPPGVPPRGPAPPPGPPPAQAGVMQRVSRCVDERRQRAETDCASYRPYLGQTAESLCLIGKVAAIYWDCLRAEAGGLGRCLGRCGGPARRCALACAGDEKHRAGLGTGMCLLRCWRTTIDPCLGKCLRP